MDVLIMTALAVTCCLCTRVWLDYYGYIGKPVGNITMGAVIAIAIVMVIGYAIMAMALDMVSLRMLYAAGS